MPEVPLRSLDLIVSLVAEKVAEKKDPSKPYVGLEHLPSGGSSLLGVSEANESISTNNVFLAGDVLFGKLRPRLRKSVRATFDGYCSTDILVLRPSGTVVPRFAAFVLQSDVVFAEAIRTEEGTKMPRCSWGMLRKLRVFCPELSEQELIAEILSTVDEAIEQTEALIAKTQKIKAGLMHDLFTRGITPDGQLRPPREEAPQLYMESPFGWIPRGWRCQALDELLANTACPMRSGPFGSALLKDELVEDGIPMLGIDNILAELFVSVFRRFVSHNKFIELHRYAVFPRDVIITIMGTVGRCAVVPGDIGDALSSKHLWTMTLDQKQVIPELVCWQLNAAPWVLSWFTRESQGAVMDAIQASTLKTLKLPVPPTSEQQQIYDRYHTCNNSLSPELSNLEKLKRLKSGLMQDLLTGRVRVPEAEEAPPTKAAANV
jgi:type I restriction enzyme S subunit